MRKATEEWLISAQDDLGTIAEIVDNPQLTHVVAFHAHSESTSSLRSGRNSVSKRHSKQSWKTVKKRFRTSTTL